jgi:predicted amidohydrolase YtcJ
LIEDDDIERVRRLGIRVITTPAFIRAQGDVLALPNSQRWPRTFRLRTLAARGFEIIGSSDSTGSIPDGIPPLYNIACAVTRRTLSGAQYVPEEALDIDDALRLFTIWPALGTFEEQDKGTISVGKLGDFAVLSADPRAVAADDPDGLFDLRAEATILGGDVIWQR